MRDIDIFIKRAILSELTGMDRFYLSKILGSEKPLPKRAEGRLYKAAVEIFNRLDEVLHEYETRAGEGKDSLIK